MLNLTVFGIKTSFDGFNYIKKTILGGEYILQLSAGESKARTFPDEQSRNEAFEELRVAMDTAKLKPVTFGNYLLNVQAIDSISLRNNIVYVKYPHLTALQLVCGSNSIAQQLYDKIDASSGSTGGDKVESVNGKTGVVVLNKNDIGLDQVDNTSDLNKPVSNATQAALDLKANIADVYNKEEVNNLINVLKQFEVEVVDVLPQPGEESILYLVPKEGSGSDVYNEYIWVGNKYELIGNTQIDLSAYATKEEVNAALKKKVDTEIQTGIGIAKIFNESDGGGAMYDSIRNNTKTFVGVNDGLDGINAQIYSKDKTSNLGARLNVTATGMYYTVKNNASFTNDDELVVKGNLNTAVNTLQSEINTKASADSVYTKSEVDQKIDNVVPRTYIHNQPTPAILWTINHNLNKRPNVTVVDVNGDEVTCEKTWLDDNNVECRFETPFAGAAYLN